MDVFFCFQHSFPSSSVHTNSCLPTRGCSTAANQNAQHDPFSLVESDLRNLFQNIRQVGCIERQHPSTKGAAVSEVAVLKNDVQGPIQNILNDKKLLYFGIDPQIDVFIFTCNFVDTHNFADDFCNS